MHQISYSLDSFKGAYIGDSIRYYFGVIKLRGMLRVETMAHRIVEVPRPTCAEHIGVSQYLQSPPQP